jgi:trans-aconitate 2-methyltransferase
MAHTWDPDRYLTFAGERGRPFIDLLARIGAQSPRRVVDLGCGPGNLTALLAERWRDARITGLDSSAEMIAAARTASDARIEFRVGDLREWAAAPEAAPDDGQDVDVLLSNATLQWVPGHLDLLPSLAARVAEDGWLAFQVPGNFAEPSHVLLAELAAEEPYAEHAADTARPGSHDPVDYLRVLEGQFEVDAWETTYLHVLTGPDPVFSWVSGTGARPVLQALPDGLRGRFEQEYKRRLAEAYPPDEATGGRVVLPFRRIFVVAHRVRTMEG